MPAKHSLIQNIIKTDAEKDWYRMEAKKNAADVFIYDEISFFGVQAQQFVKDLNELDVKTIRLHLNTPGGNVFDGAAIYNALRQHTAKVETYIEGLAASAGSIVALAGDTVKMAANAFFMIHQPWVLAMGDSAELRKTADILDKISSVMIDTYVNVSGQSEEQIKQWVTDETWFTAKEAKEAGFVDEITDEIEIKNQYDLSIYNNVPGGLAAEFARNSSMQKKGNYAIAAFAETGKHAFNINNELENLSERKKQMPQNKDVNMTLDSFKADHADLYDQIFSKGKAEGEKNERDAFAKIAELCENDNDLAVKCFMEGKADVEVLQAKNAKLKNELENVKNSKPAEKTGDTDPAVVEFADNADKIVQNAADEPGDGKPKTFMQAVEMKMESDGCSKAEAVKACAKEYPKLHENMRLGKQ